MSKNRRILLLLLIAAVVVMTAQWWLDPVWNFLGANDTQIQAIDSLIAILVVLIPLVGRYLSLRKQEMPSETLGESNRRVMLNHVENFWVKGLLDQSLHGVAMLELGFKREPSALSYPWTIKRESTDEILPAGMSMLEIYEEIGMGRSLLILGTPGAGKTTMLLELARELLDYARQDKEEPIPVVFKLDSWKEGQSLADWLVEQLNLVYSVPGKFAASWVNENSMLLLLDGLDEVVEQNRPKCVQVINEFRKEHGLTSLAVCCRQEEYKATRTKLNFEGAITIQPLTAEQIGEYVDRFGNSLPGLRRSLARDLILRELAETPLMLSIMAFAYKDLRVEELQDSDSAEQTREHLFDTYIHRMFERPIRSQKVPFTKEQTLHYLSWLARTMIRQEISAYQIEAMQPSWIEQQSQIRQCLLIIRLCVGLSVGLCFGLGVGLVGGWDVGLISGLSVGLIIGLGGGKVFEFEIDRIVMFGRSTWSWRQLREHFVSGLGAGLIMGLIIGVIRGLVDGWGVGLTVGLIFGSYLGLIIGLIGGWADEQIEETSYPEQRLKQTLYNSLFSSLITGLFFAGIFGISAWFFSETSGRLGAFLLALPFFALGTAMFFGLASLLQHYALRLVLARKQLLPWQLIPFLGHCQDLVFLRRVGGSYIFVHRLLMEHFAKMDV